MSNILLRIADRALNRPLFLHPDKAMIIHDVLSGRIGTDQIGSVEKPDANRLTGSNPAYRGSGLAYSMHGNTPVIPIIGSLVNRGAYVGASSGVLSYEGVEAQFDQAIKDNSPSQIAMDIDSPGGEATGMFGLAEKILAIRNSGIKVIAVVNDMAASAAYGLAAQASEIWVSPTSIVGSIGTVMLHLDRSGELEQKGIKPTFIFAGRHKVDGHAFGPLPDSVRDDLKQEVMVFYDQFINSVAAGRGDRLSADAARATEARILIGEAAIAAGLADRIASISDLNATASTSGRPAASQQRKAPMSNSNSPGAPAAENEGITQDEHDTAVNNARTDGRADGKSEGATAERERIGAIVRHEAAKGKRDQAISFALDTDLTVDQAAAVLGNSVAEQAPGLTPEATGGPEIGASAAGNAPVSDAAVAADISKKAVDRINARNRSK